MLESPWGIFFYQSSRFYKYGALQISLIIQSLTISIKFWCNSRCCPRRLSSHPCRDRPFVSYTYFLHRKPHIYAAIIDSDVLAVPRVTSSSMERVCPAVVTRVLNQLLLSTIVANSAIKSIHGHCRVTLFQVIKSDVYFIGHCVLEARQLLWWSRGGTKETNVNRCLYHSEQSA